MASGVPAGVGRVAGGVVAWRRRALARVARFVYLISFYSDSRERHLHYHNEGLAPRGGRPRADFDVDTATHNNARRNLVFLELKASRCTLAKMAMSFDFT